MTAKLYIDVDPVDMMDALGKLPTFEDAIDDSPNVPEASS
jgi:hypothetical protein